MSQPSVTRFVYSRLAKLITGTYSKTVLICSDASGSEVCVISMLGSEKYAADHGVFKLDQKVCDKAELDLIRMNMLVDFLYRVRFIVAFQGNLRDVIYQAASEQLDSCLLSSGKAPIVSL